MDKEDTETDIRLVKKPVKKNADITSLQIDLSKHIFIGGITQSGKSYAMKRLFDSMPSDRRCIFYDYKHDPNHTAWIKKNHYPIYTTLGGIKRNWATTYGSVQKFLTHKKPHYKVIFQPKRPKGYKGVYAQVEELSDYVFQKGNVTLFLDEAAPLMTPSDIAPSLYDCYIMGASRGVVVVAVSQRPMGIYNVVLSECYTKLLFRMLLKGDRDKIEGCTSREVADQLKSLPNHTFLIVFADGTYNKCTLKYDGTK